MKKRQEMQARRLVVVMCLFLGTLSLLGGIWIGFFNSGDLHLRLTEIRIMADRGNPYESFIAAKKAAPYNDPMTENGEPYHPDYAPSLLFPMVPLAFLPHKLANVLWLIVEVMAMYYLLFYVFDGNRPKSERDYYAFLIATSAFLFSLPFRNGLGMGQTALVSFAAFVLAHELSERKKVWKSGLLLAVSWTKYTVVWPMVLCYFILGRKWKETTIAVALHSVIHLAASVWLDVNPISLCRSVLKVNGVLASFPHAASSPGKFDLFNEGARIVRAIDVSPIVGSAVLCTAFTALVCTIWCFRRERSLDPQWLCALGCLGSLTLPAKTFNLVFLYPALVQLSMVRNKQFHHLCSLCCISYLLFAEKIILENDLSCPLRWSLINGLCYGLLIACTIFEAGRNRRVAEIQ